MAASSTDPITRLEAALNVTESTPSKRMLVIINPYATTVSDRLKSLVVYALRGRYHVDAVDTERRDHATELCREAASEGYDVVVAFGGDGTVNEAANGLAGTTTPLSCLPGGRANVYCRMLGIPADVVDATEHLLRLADDWHPRPVDLGQVNGRYFVFSAGVGLDASVVERVDAHPRLKARLGEWYYTWIAVSTFNRRYLWRPPRFVAEVAGARVAGVEIVVQNSSPYTYFGDRPVEARRRRRARQRRPRGGGARARESARHPKHPVARAVAPTARQPPPPRPSIHRGGQPAGLSSRRQPDAPPSRRRLHRRGRRGAVRSDARRHHGRVLTGGRKPGGWRLCLV